MIKIGITDDHSLIIKGLSSLVLLENDMELISSFTDGQSTITAFKKNINIDILILDINLPDMDGCEVCKQVLILNPNLKILVLTSFNDTCFVKKIMRAGAKGFIIKSSSDEIILEGIRAVAAGEQYIQKELQTKLASESLLTPGQEGFRPKLTRREKEVLRLITEEFTTQEIADKLFLSPKTIETHRLNLLHKMDVKNMAGLVKVAMIRNYI